MPIITNIEDLRVMAQKRVPRMFYDYADSGSWTEGTYRANESDFQRIKLRQRVAVNMENRSTRSTMIGQSVAMPVLVQGFFFISQRTDEAAFCRRKSSKVAVVHHEWCRKWCMDLQQSGKPQLQCKKANGVRIPGQHNAPMPSEHRSQPPWYVRSCRIARSSSRKHRVRLLDDFTRQRNYFSGVPWSFCSELRSPIS